MPKAMVGISAPPTDALSAASGAMTPLISPLPNPLLGLEMISGPGVGDPACHRGSQARHESDQGAYCGGAEDEFLMPQGFPHAIPFARRRMTDTDPGPFDGEVDDFCKGKKTESHGDDGDPLLQIGNPEAPAFNSQDGILADEGEEHAQARGDNTPQRVPPAEYCDQGDPEDAHGKEFGRAEHQHEGSEDGNGNGQYEGTEEAADQRGREGGAHGLSRFPSLRHRMTVHNRCRAAGCSRRPDQNTRDGSRGKGNGGHPQDKGQRCGGV